MPDAPNLGQTVRKIPTWAWIGVGGGALIAIVMMVRGGSSQPDAGSALPGGAVVTDLNTMLGQFGDTMDKKIQSMTEQFGAVYASEIEGLKTTFADSLAAMSADLGTLSASVGELGTSVTAQITQMSQLLADSQAQLNAALGNVNSQLGSIVLVQQQQAAIMADLQSKWALMIASLADWTTQHPTAPQSTWNPGPRPTGPTPSIGIPTPVGGAIPIPDTGPIADWGQYQ